MTQMPIKTKLTHLSLMGVMLLGLFGGCRHNQDPDIAILDKLSEAEANPSAERPKTYFPPEWQQPDKTINDFILKVLDTCHRGDYDKFCQFMATTETPPGQENFSKIWHVVGDITVRSVRSDGKTPPSYYVHAIAKLRRPDAQKRTQRNLIVRVFKEMDQWRIAAATQDVERKILVADSQPASGPDAEGGPTGQANHPAAPSTRPAVYKTKHQGS
jgi:hypothetical protein